MIPDVARDTLLDSLSRFDRELRATPAWAGWEQNRVHKYAITHDGRYYPVKQIIFMATGLPKPRFLGGSQANTYVERRGFQVIRLERR